jgi:hypothetical protein
MNRSGRSPGYEMFLLGAGFDSYSPVTNLFAPLARYCFGDVAPTPVGNTEISTLDG